MLLQIFCPGALATFDLYHDWLVVTSWSVAGGRWFAAVVRGSSFVFLPGVGRRRIAPRSGGLARLRFVVRGCARRRRPQTPA